MHSSEHKAFYSQYSLVPPLMFLWGWASSQWAAHALSGKYRGTNWGSGWSSAHRLYHLRRQAECWCSGAASSPNEAHINLICDLNIKSCSLHLNIWASYLTHLFKLTHSQGEKCDKLLLILAHAHTSNLSEALQCHIAKHGHVQELNTDEKDVWFTAVRNPCLAFV